MDTLSDALFLLGVTALVIAAMGEVKNRGLFDIVSYGNKVFLNLVLNRPQASTTGAGGFASYVQRKRKKYHVRTIAVGGVCCMVLSTLLALMS